MPKATDKLDVLKEFMLGLVRADQKDLTARQLSLFLLIYQTPGPHTVRGLARALDIVKPAVSRSLDMLEERGLVVRMPDSEDRRSILLGQTRAGGAFYRRLVRFVDTAMRAKRSPPAPPAA